MRTGTIAKALLLLLLAWPAAISAAKDPAGAFPDAPRPTPAPPQPAPLPGEIPTPSEEPLRPTTSDLGTGAASFPDGGVASTEPSGRQGAYDAGPCPAWQTLCGRCGCHRRNAECGQMPFGAAVCAAMKTQICNGVGARMVLYHYDFCDAAGPDGYKLNEHGMARLRDIVRMFQCLNCHPIMIEYTSRNSPLDAARREYVVRMLSQMDASIPDPLVMVGKPETPAVSGREAILLDGSEKAPYKTGLMARTQSEGQNPPPSPSMLNSGSGQSSTSTPGSSSGTAGQ